MRPAPKPTKAAIPTQKTLEKYGLTEADFLDMLERQNYTCPICGKTPNPDKSGKVRFVVDHYHAKGWKKMPPEKRRLYVRGLLCWYDNRYFLSKGITAEKAQAVVNYLKDFEDNLWKNARADVVNLPMTGITVSSDGARDFLNSTINETLSTLTTLNTLAASLITENGASTSGKSNVKSTAKRR